MIGDGDPVREVLRDVYSALSLELDPSTVGALEDALPGVGVDAVAAEVVARLRGDDELDAAGIDADTMALATTLLPRHEAQR